jgi:hypothetical protein
VTGAGHQQTDGLNALAGFTTNQNTDIHCHKNTSLNFPDTSSVFDAMMLAVVRLSPSRFDSDNWLYMTH